MTGSTRLGRREFIGGGICAGTAALAGGAFAAQPADAPKPEFAWSYLVHFGMNMWGDLPRTNARNGLIKKWLTDEEFALLDDPEYMDYSRIRFDEAIWRELADRLRNDGCNQIVVDVGEFLKYPSHPELAVKGSWEPERLAAEVRRLQGMGFEVVPKLNFSCCHHAWLGPYARMVSTSKYYEVCSDLIRDVLEVFKGTRFLHLGLDEEQIPSYQKHSSLLVIRQGELWWHDVLWLVKEVEKHGVRAWMWHDFLRKNKMEEFAKRMPKTVVQSPWTYQVGDTDRYQNLCWMFGTLSKGGYDTIPCSSHCYGGCEGFIKVGEWCRKNMDPRHFIGYQMAPWMQTGKAYRRLLLKGSELIADARRAMGMKEPKA